MAKMRKVKKDDKCSHLKKIKDWHRLQARKKHKLFLLAVSEVVETDRKSVV